jgi:hypothetical protein
VNGAGAVDVLFDVAGYYESGSGGSWFDATGPRRIVDSRTGEGTARRPWGAEHRVVSIPHLPVPNNVTAVVLNVTVTGPTAPSYLTIWPAGSAMPLASNINFVPGQTRANQVTVPVSADGRVEIANAAGVVDVILDIAGYYSQEHGRAFHPLDPVRVLDTRTAGTAGPPARLGADPRTIDPRSIAGIVPPAGVYVMNVTALAATVPTFVSVQPAEGDWGTSSLNLTPGEIVPNQVTPPTLYPGTSVTLQNHAGSVDVVVDLEGYFL